MYVYRLCIFLYIIIISNPFTFRFFIIYDITHMVLLVLILLTVLVETFYYTMLTLRVCIIQFYVLPSMKPFLTLKEHYNSLMYRIQGL